MTVNSDHLEAWLSEVSLRTVLSMFRDRGVSELLFKVLPKNANSKNQVYLASDLSQLSHIPSGDVSLHVSTSRKSGVQEAVFRSALTFFWLDQAGEPHLAPGAKLIFYPQFPEVRFSGFLKGCSNAPSFLWDKEKRGGERDRILLLGVDPQQRVLGLTLPPESPAAKEILEMGRPPAYGALCVLPVPGEAPVNTLAALMSRLSEIHHLKWVRSTRLNARGDLVDCNATNCNGNTLEALLGIRSNGIARPDFMGWEIKARQVPNSENPGSSVVTLFTPEPSGGFYVERGVTEFIRTYGYADRTGREDRLNVGGIYRVNAEPNANTGLRLILEGFDGESGTISPNGAVRLLTLNGTVAAEWSFMKLMDHWKVKHAQAAYVPAQQRTFPERQYRFGRLIQLGEGAEFRLFLRGLLDGKIYYDPGIKLEGVSTDRPKSKKRSQFRVASKNLFALYRSIRVVDACDGD